MRRSRPTRPYNKTHGLLAPLAAQIQSPHGPAARAISSHHSIHLTQIISYPLRNRHHQILAMLRPLIHKDFIMLRYINI